MRFPQFREHPTIDGEIVSETRNGVARDYVPDPLGSTVALLDSNQNKTDTFTYWPYGEERTRTGVTPTPFGFGGAAGYYRDAPGRTYVRARHLGTQHGRWLTPDPVSPAASPFNFYWYARSSPTDVSDPSGLSPIQDFWKCFDWLTNQQPVAKWKPEDACKYCKKYVAKGAVQVDCDSPYFDNAQPPPNP